MQSNGYSQQTLGHMALSPVRVLSALATAVA
jgi:hypothetical protein